MDLFKGNKFYNAGALDIVYYLLDGWLASVKGGTV
jgi:hypothetical protein